MSRVRDAWHESGHACVAHRVGRKVKRVSISEAGGGVMCQEPLGGEVSDDDVQRLATIFLAGTEGEKYAPVGPISADANGSGEFSWTAVEALLEQDGLRDSPTDDDAISLYAGRLGAERMEEARALAEELVGRAFVVGHLERVADALLLHSAISGADLEEILYASA